MKKLTISLCSSILISSFAFAHFYGWPINKTPPVELDSAYKTAALYMKELDLVGHCVSANLYGNKDQDGKNGYWDFRFDSPSRKYTIIRVNMKNEASMELIGNEKPNQGMEPIAPTFD